MFLKEFEIIWNEKLVYKKHVLFKKRIRKNCCINNWNNIVDSITFNFVNSISRKLAIIVYFKEKFMKFEFFICI